MMLRSQGKIITRAKRERLTNFPGLRTGAVGSVLLPTDCLCIQQSLCAVIETFLNTALYTFSCLAWRITAHNISGAFLSFMVWVV